jgi:hypothetical protein
MHIAAKRKQAAAKTRSREQGMHTETATTGTSAHLTASAICSALKDSVMLNAQSAQIAPTRINALEQSSRQEPHLAAAMTANATTADGEARFVLQASAAHNAIQTMTAIQNAKITFTLAQAIAQETACAHTLSRTAMTTISALWTTAMRKKAVLIRL